MPTYSKGTNTQGQGQGSIVPTAINSAVLAPQTPIQIPQAPTDSSAHVAAATGGQAQVDAINQSFADLQAQQDAAQQNTASDPNSLDSILSGFSASSTPPPSAATQYNSDYAAAGIDPKQADFNAKQQLVLDAQGKLTATNAQLAGLTAAKEAIPIQTQQNLLTQGRIATASGIAPEDSAALRNNALKALPLQAQALAQQAQVAAAQGQAGLSQSILQQAQDHLDTIFKIHSQDATNMYNYQKELRDNAMKVASTAQQQQFATQQKQADQAFTTQRDSINNAQALAKIAMDNGQGTLAAKIAGLDPKSPAFASDLARLQGQITQNPLDIQLKKAQIANEYANLADKQASTKLKNAQASQFGNPNLVQAIQAGLIDPTKVNSRNIGLMSALANANVNVNQLGIDAKATSKVITNLDTQKAQIQQAGKALETNMALLANLSDKVNKLGIPAADTNLNAYMAKYSNQPDIVNYLSTLNTVRSEYAKYIARGAQVDDSVRKDAANAIPAGIDGATLRSLLSVTQQEGANVLQSIQEAKNGQWDSLQGTNNTYNPSTPTVRAPDGTLVQIID